MISKKSKKLSKGKVLVAMSGGVDSSVAAYLLKKQGYEVAGVTMQIWTAEKKGFEAVQNIKDVKAVCRKLKIPHHILNVEKNFKSKVVDYFSKEYIKGRTPNPCTVCNKLVKFKDIMAEADKLGFDVIATGHYAQILEKKERFHVAEGIDQIKDQAYMLFALPQKVLKRTIFPNGDKTKAQIRAIARRAGLKVSEKKESMDICFIPDNDYVKFLVQKGGAKTKKGRIRLKSGEVVGEHDGYFQYTIGQRRGLGVAYKEPLYVLNLDSKKNEVIVGNKLELQNQSFKVTKMHWMKDVKGGEELDVFAKIRLNTPKKPARIKISADKKSVSAAYIEPQEAITPGQAAVFFDKDLIIGGGWIEKVT